MINNLVIGCNVYTFNTDTQEVHETRDLGYNYLRAKFFVEKTGKFTFPERFKLDPIDVEVGDYILVFERIGDEPYSYVKTNIKEAISIMDEIDAYREKMRKKRHNEEETANGEDINNI